MKFFNSFTHFFSDFQHPFPMSQRHIVILWCIILCAIALRIFFAMPGLLYPDPILMRPDSPTYLNPALSLLEEFQFHIAPLSSIVETGRTPGYPALLALTAACFGQHLWIHPLIGILISTLTVYLIFRIACFFLSSGRALFATSFAALNLTAISCAPLFLSDNFFALAITFQLFCFLPFYFTGKIRYFFLSVSVAALAAYIRPINLYFIVPMLFLLCIHPQISVRKKIGTALSALFLFCLILLPWMWRNEQNGGGFSMSTIDGPTLYFHSGAALESVRTGESAETIRQRWMMECDSLFSVDSHYLTAGARNTYLKSKAKTEILKSPFLYLKLSLRPYILLPDIPTLCENLHISVSGKGTFAILNQDGLIPAVKHYFDGILWILIPLFPLLCLTGLMYLGMVISLLQILWRKNYSLLFLFAAFSYYYLFVPGPLSMPRFQLPALPLIIVFGTSGLFSSWSFLKTYYIFLSRKLN